MVFGPSQMTCPKSCQKVPQKDVKKWPQQDLGAKNNPKSCNKVVKKMFFGSKLAHKQSGQWSLTWQEFWALKAVLNALKSGI